MGFWPDEGCGGKGLGGNKINEFSRRWIVERANRWSSIGEFEFKEHYCR